jgi:hypothetical protein
MHKDHVWNIFYVTNNFHFIVLCSEIKEDKIGGECGAH